MGVQERSAGTVRRFGDRVMSVKRGTVVKQPAPAAPPERTFTASTVIVAPVDAGAARIVRAAFEAARLDYGPATIGDLRDSGAAHCHACSDIIGSSTVDGIRWAPTCATSWNACLH